MKYQTINLIEIMNRINKFYMPIQEYRLQNIQQRTDYSIESFSHIGWNEYVPRVKRITIQAAFYYSPSFRRKRDEIYYITALVRGNPRDTILKSIND